MEITSGKRSCFEVSELDHENEIEFVMHKEKEDRNHYWINIESTIELIRFLETQVDTFNNK